MVLLRVGCQSFDGAGHLCIMASSKGAVACVEWQNGVFSCVVYYCKVPVRVWNFGIVFCLRVGCQNCVVLSRVEFRQ